MTPSAGRTGSPNASGWQSSPRQTHLSKNDKTVIRWAVNVEAKLGNQKSADGNGDAPYFVPTPRIGGRVTTLGLLGRAGFSVAHGQIGFAPHGEALLSLVRVRTARVQHPRRLYVRNGRCSLVSVRERRA